MGFRWFFLALTMTLSSISYAQDKEAQCIDKATSIEEKLGCLEGVTYTSELTEDRSSKVFEIQFEQLNDHKDIQRGKFSQKLILIHRGESEPVVLQTSGYSIFAVADSRISRVFQTNQIQVEHRFFAGSTPSELDWGLLNIKQAADDFHAVTVKFKKIYKGPWVNTGASKGGMTSIYHRYFYPEDMAGTVADVAPLSFTRRDQRYNDFLNSVGGDQYKECRAKWQTFQIQLLKNRKELVPLFKGTFTHLGSADVAFEHAVIEAPFYFWQYSSPENTAIGCRAIPSAEATPQEMLRFLTAHASADYFTDEMINTFQAYFYQAATELGAPDNYTAHLETLREFEFELGMYTPKGIDLPYSNTSMRKVDEWVQTEASDILFIYGSFDPWTAAEFNVGENSNNVHKLFVEGGNHGVGFTVLEGKSYQLAVDVISTWLQKGPVLVNELATANQRSPTIEELEIQKKRRLGLP